MYLKEGMEYPPQDWLREKMIEHSVWYTGDESQLTDYYSLQRTRMTTTDMTKDMFWSRQYRAQGNNIPLHVPVASDISSTCADLLFGDTPEFKISEAYEKNASKSYLNSQEALDNMLSDVGFYAKLLEAAESASALGGVYIKIAWDEELSQYPIPVIEQADDAYPEFKFGVLTGVTFCKTIRIEPSNSSSTGTIWRLAENYTNKGTIEYHLFKGTTQNLGKEYSLDALEETKDLENVDTGINMILCVYVPNILPNRMSRTSYTGRSDYQGIESIFHSLDETYSSWMRDIYLAKGRLVVPQAYLRKRKDGSNKFDLDETIFESLSMDPTALSGKSMDIVQFEIRSDQYYKTCLELITRAVTSAGYSPQTFGINIEGRAESGTALNIRERKSFNTKVKKEQYWEQALKKLIRIMIQVYTTQLNGKMEQDFTVITEFSDGANNTLSEMATSLQALANAQALSTEQKVRYLHNDWSEDQIRAEVQAILNETQQPTLEDPDFTQDFTKGDE